jgi:GH15 family glucan-1,4-alpha-glucosidase
VPPRFTTSGSFPQIADYGFLSDCEVAALIAPSGNVEWFCLPQFDSPSIFGAMLDRDAGRFRLGPADVEVPATRRYVPGSMVLETAWTTRTGWLMTRDALTIGPWHHVGERAFRQRRAPQDWEADHVLLRTVRCAHGTIELRLECEPWFEYGQIPAHWEYTGAGYHQAEATCEGGDLRIRLDSDLNLGVEGSRVNARKTLREGDVAFVALSWSEHGGPESFHDAFERMNRTSDYWREWLDHGRLPDHPWRGHLERSALTLKGLSYAPTSAIAAAATTSLPRVPGGQRNWDYRYSFLRDSAFTLWALYSLGFDWEADDFLYFLADVADKEDGIQNVYAVDGRRALEEKALDHLSGYGGARPVRIGNASFEYDQHDVWGAMLDAAYLHVRTRDKLPERVWPVVKRLVELAVERWQEPDRGIWALRGEPQHYVSSKVLCWVAVDRGARLARLREQDDLRRRWQAVADEIREDVLAKGISERGVFRQHYETDDLDASLLLLVLLRFLPPMDPRIRNTVLAIADELSEGGLVLRRRPADEEFEVEGETFTVCSFWIVSALCEIQEVERARDLCERLLAYTSPLGLYAEHLDPDTGRHLGNFPHAFTHLALINALMHLIKEEWAMRPAA